MILLFLLIVGVSAKCRNGGVPNGDECKCVDGYTGNHCQISPPSMCKHINSVVDLDSHVIIDSDVIEKCTDYVSTDCYASPWSLITSGADVQEIEIDYTVQPSVNANCENIQCQPNYTHMGGSCDDIGCDFNTVCCEENEKCSNRICALKEGYNVVNINPQTYSSGLTFTETEHTDNCCKNDESCEHSDFTCKYIKDAYCEGDCTSADFEEDGNEETTCCTPLSWKCIENDNTCPVGFVKNSNTCGTECSSAFEASVTPIYVYTTINSGDTTCNGVEQPGVTTVSECFQRCQGSYTHFYMNGNCFCINDIVGRCGIYGCSMCPNGVTEHTNILNRGEPAAICEGALASQSDYCPSGWFRSGWHPLACIRGSTMNREYKNYCTRQCYIPDNNGQPYGDPSCGYCCTPTRYATYSISETLELTGSTCCDVDNTVTLDYCTNQECPDRYTYVEGYETKFYGTDHTTACCDQIPDSHFCDHAYTTCNIDGYRKVTSLIPDDTYCEKTCTVDDCCIPDSHYCDESFTCTGDYKLTRSDPGPTFSTTGNCIIDTEGYCVMSSNYPSNYDSSDDCEITVLASGSLDVKAFETENGYDQLQVGGQGYGYNDGVRYTGTSGPHDVNVNEGDKMYWHSDGSVTEGGFKICLSPPVEYSWGDDPYCGKECTSDDCCFKDETSFYCSAVTNCGDATKDTSLIPDSTYCGKTCTTDDCCIPDSHFCDKHECGSGYVKQGTPPAQKFTTDAYTGYEDVEGDCFYSHATRYYGSGQYDYYGEWIDRVYTAQASGTLNVIDWYVQTDGEDRLIINDVWYYGSTRPQGITVNQGDEILWKTDGWGHPGARKFKICLQNAVMPVKYDEDNPYCNGECTDAKCCYEN